MSGGTAGSLPKSQGNTIYGADYNAVQTKVRGVLGDGNGYDTTYGYGQTLSSVPVSATAVVSHSEWQNLVSDISKTYQHQNGVTYTAVNPTAGQTISTSTINTLSGVCDTLLTNRLTVNAGQLTTAQIAQPTYSGTWGVGNHGIQAIVSISFGSVRNAQYFFNQGGYVVITGYYSTSGWSNSQQDQNWQSEMNSFSFTINYTQWNALVGWENTFGTPDVVLSDHASFTGNYTSNYVQVIGQTSDQGATLSITLTYNDTHPNTWQDGVDGIIGATFTSHYATGAFTGIQPTATVTSNFTTY